MIFVPGSVTYFEENSCICTHALELEPERDEINSQIKLQLHILHPSQRRTCKLFKCTKSMKVDLHKK